MPIALSTLHADILENILVNHLSYMIPYFILGPRLHIASANLTGTLILYVSHENHSGYNFPWSLFKLIPFEVDSAYHDFHHSKNVGCYSNHMTIWDSLFDTNKEYYSK